MLALLFLLALQVQPLSVSGTLTAVDQTVQISNVGQASTIAVALNTTTWTAGSITFEVRANTIDAWTVTVCSDVANNAITSVLTVGSQAPLYCQVSGLLQFRVRALPGFSGTLSMTLRSSAMVNSTVSVNNFPVTQAVSIASLPGVQVTSVPTTPVTGTFWQTTQPVSGSIAVDNFPSTQAVSGSLTVTNFPSSTLVTGTFWQATQPISVATLPLPTGAATVAAQASGNNSLTSIDAKLPTLILGRTPVDLPSVTANAGTNLNTSSLALEAGHLAALDTKLPSQGQALAGASLPVVLTAAQVATLTPPAGITGFALDATLTGGTQTARLTDGTNTATVKAASAAAVAADKALVVAVSPNNTVPVTGTFWQATQPVSGSLSVSNFPATQPVSGTFWQSTQPVSGTFWQATQPVSITSLPALATGTNTIGGVTIGQAVRTSGTLTSTTCPGTGCVPVTTSGYGVATVTINGTYSLTPIFEFSDDGTTWYATTCTRTDAAVQESAPAALVNLTRAWDCSIYSTTNFRVRATTFTSGTANIGILLSATHVEAAPTVSLAVDTQQGVASPATIRVILANEATYGASLTLMTATGIGTGPFFNICGSATKTIRIQRIRIGGTVATTAKYGDVILKKTSAATSAGTATTLTAVPLDSSSGAATATVKYYTVLGTAGALIGAIEGQMLFLGVTGTVATIPAPADFFWRDTDSEAPTLRGTAQCIEANFGTSTATAPTLLVSVKWTEK